MSQSELALRSGIPQNYISLIENGKKDPTLSTLQKLADGLGKRLEFVDKPEK
jgi:transcriptional regulator with XRE-family HTH domain